MKTPELIRMIAEEILNNVKPFYGQSEYILPEYIYDFIITQLNSHAETSYLSDFIWKYHGAFELFGISAQEDGNVFYQNKPIRMN